MENDELTAAAMEVSEPDSETFSDLHWSTTESEDDESCSKKPRLDASEDDDDEEAKENEALKSIILVACEPLLRFCIQLSTPLYQTVLEGAATLVILIYDKAELQRGFGTPHLFQQCSNFFNQLEEFALKKTPISEICKSIVFHEKIDWQNYPLLTDLDIGGIFEYYRAYPYEKPYKKQFYLDKIKTDIDDDILEVIKKVKLRPRLNVDQYTSLLLEFSRDMDVVESQEDLLARAVKIIDIEALYRLDDTQLAILPSLELDISPQEEFDLTIKQVLIRILTMRRTKVKYRVETALCPLHELVLDEIEAKNYMTPISKVVFQMFEVAELRRQAEGSRFVNRDHFMWAFAERGCEIPDLYKQQATGRIAAEVHPPYHIYLTAFALAMAEQTPLQYEHLAFAVVSDSCFGLSDEEVKTMKANFQDFKTALYKSGLSSVPTPLVSSADSEKIFYLSSFSVTTRMFKNKLEENHV